MFVGTSAYKVMLLQHLGKLGILSSTKYHLVGQNKECTQKSPCNFSSASSSKSLVFFCDSKTRR